MHNKCTFLALVLVFINFSFLKSQESYKTLIHKGNKAFYSKNYDEAAAQFMEAAKQNEKDFAAHYNLGNTLYKTEKYDEAKAEYQKAQQYAKDLKDKNAALHNLGNSYMKTNQPEKAAEFYKQALKKDPYNDATRKNYEIAKLKEKEKQQKNNQDSKDGKNGDNQDKNQDNKQGQDKGENKNQQGGTGGNQKIQGSGNGQGNKEKEEKSIPDDIEKSILDRISEKEKQTGRRILNKNGYSIPESKEKDW